MGTSIQVGQGDDLYRLHIHVPAEKRYDPIDLHAPTRHRLESGHRESAGTDRRPNAEGTGRTKLNSAKCKPGQIAAVAVSPGAGLTRVFASLGVSAVVPGGQSMNPSTQEILSSFADLPAEKIIILPNNKNILLAAQQTSALTAQENRHRPLPLDPPGDRRHAGLSKRRATWRRSRPR